MKEIPDNADCAELNVRYGAPGKIVFREGKTGYPEVAIANKYGSAEISLYGAHVLSYRPTGNHPVLFVSGKSNFTPGKAIRGGIPVCWPWFGWNGPEGSPQHGFARIMPWRVSGAEYSDEITEITLELPDAGEYKKFWPYSFKVELRISVSMKLNMNLVTENTGSEPFSLTEGFHPYFSVRDRNSCVTRGVEGLEFQDASDGWKWKTQTGDLVHNSPSDFVYKPVKNEWALVDNSLKRAIAVMSRGNRRLVIWNPGPTTPEKFPDLDSEDYRKFICVEPASTPKDSSVTVNPGEKHELLMAVQSIAEGVKPLNA